MEFALIIPCLCFFAVALADKKINLEDIEQDNLRAESKSRAGNPKAQETSYNNNNNNVPVNLPKASDNYEESYDVSEDISGYGNHRQSQDKYNDRPEVYQEVKNLANEVEYQQSPQPIRYADYQSRVEPEVPGKSLPQASSYETPRQLFYQPEVTVGNRYQRVQQKKASDKFANNFNRETLYVNIPMAQLLSYYPNIGFEAPISKSQGQLSIPVYVPSFDPIYSNTKTTYQIQPQYASHASRYPLSTEAILPTSASRELTYPRSSLAHVPSHRQSQQPQPHYLQEIVYSQQPEGLPTNSIGLQNYPTVQHQSYTPYDHQQSNYVITKKNPASHLANEIYHQQQHENDNVRHQDSDNIPEVPDSKLDLPRLPAQNFKSSAAKENENSHYAENYSIQSSEPRSLLESYVPSHYLAAQNSERYRERPIRLEGGFLPSKINFLHSYKKRKID